MYNFECERMLTCGTMGCGMLELSGSSAGSADISSGRMGAWCRPLFSPMQCTLVACAAS